MQRPQNQPYTPPYPQQYAPLNMKNMKQCKKCKSAIDKKAKICPFCRTKQKSHSFIIVLCGILAAVVIIPLISSGTDNNTSTTTYTEPTETVSTSEERSDSPWADDFTSINDFRYTLDNNQHTITLERYIGDDNKIMLSPYYNIDGTDYKLISMGDNACFLSETHITSVYIPESVTFIGASCFNSCSSLEHLYIPATATFENGFLSYLHDYRVEYNSTIATKADRDTNSYSKVDNSVDRAEEAGEDAARAINGLFGGLDEDVTVNIYYGGSKEQWETMN